MFLLKIFRLFFKMVFGRFFHEKKILLILTSGLGNTIMTIPLLTELRRLIPNYKITVVGSKSNISLITDNRKLYDKAYSYDGNKKLMTFLLELLVSKKYNDQISFIDFYKYIIIPYSCDRWSAVLKKIGLAKNIIYVKTRNEAIIENANNVEYEEGKNELELNLSAVKYLTDKDVKIDIPRLIVSEEEKEKAVDYLEKNNVDKSKMIIIHGGFAKSGTIKAIPLKMIEQIIEHFSDKYEFILLSGPDEKYFLEKNDFSKIKNRLKIFDNISDIKILAAVLSCAKLLISADTGPSHIAAAAGIPVISIFGPTDNKRCIPLGGLSKSVRVIKNEKCDCLNCWDLNGNRGCPFERKCLNSIPDKDVINTILELLDSHIVKS